jgi:hypothetical protein
MAKKKNKKETTIGVLLAVARKVEREDYVAALREGRKLRATTFADRKKVANKKACRDSRYW